MGLSAGGQILIAQKTGAKDKKGQMEVLKASLLLALIGGVLFAAIAYFGTNTMLRLLQTPEEAFDDAKTYMQIAALGLIATFFYQTIAAVLRGLGDSRRPLLFAGIATGGHALLGFLFVFVFSFGIVGAALSGIIAQAIAAVVGLFFLRRYRGDTPLRKLRVDKKTCASIIKLGLPFGLQMGLLHLANIFVLRLVASFGVATVAAVGAGARVTNLLTLPMMAIGNGASSMIGQTLGAREPKRAKTVIRWAKIYTLGFIFVTTALTLIFPAGFLRIFTSDTQVIEIGVTYLRILSFAYLAHALHSAFNAALLGSGRTKFSLHAAGVEALIGRIFLTWMLSKFFGLTGIFIAQVISTYLGTFVILYYYRREDWEKMLER